MISSILRERIVAWAEAGYTAEQTAKLIGHPTAEVQAVIDQDQTTKERA